MIIFIKIINTLQGKLSSLARFSNYPTGLGLLNSSKSAQISTLNLMWAQIYSLHIF